MKALEKAAKDRGEARTEPAATTISTRPKPELSLALELLAADTPSPQRKEDAPLKPGPGQRTSAAAPAREPAQAAAVMQTAGSRGLGGFGVFVRTRPLVAFGALAALFALGFGIYVYLQIFNPAVLIRQAPAPKAPPLLSQAPVPIPVAPPPIPSAPLLQSPAPEAPPPPAARAAATAPQPKPPVAAAAQKSDPGSSRNAVVVSRSNSAQPTVNPVLTDAYTALQTGRMETAQRLYAQLARAEPKSIDALLGLAAISLQEGKTEDASRYYLQILEIEPRNALAQSGLIGLMGRADPLAAESRLKQLIAREPSAFLYFTLGNLYADQSLWAQAQLAYFQAHHLEPNNPDYAYNLAVGLEHLSQSRLALGFYRRAVQLATDRGHANFNPAQAQERISKLATQVE